MKAYIATYPVYKTLCKKIENEILNNKEKKNISAGKGSTFMVDYTFGKIRYDVNIDFVRVAYPLAVEKYKDAIKEQLFTLYQEYEGMEIREEPIRNTGFDYIRKPCNLVVSIPCAFNKIYYLKLEISEKRKLGEEAISNISNGLVLFNNEDITNKR